MRVWLLTMFLAGWLCAAGQASYTQPARRSERMIGMYVHQHWPYNHPYAARTWTLDDWRGYAEGMKQLGYNTFLIWPVLETMPDPLTASDRASLTKTGKVIDMLHNEFGMRVFVCLCPNIMADDKIASRTPFEKRHYYYCDTLVNPADPAAVAKMMKRRETQMRYLAKVDGVAIIDSDPGCYPGSTTADFIHLLGEHRKIFDRVRPGIELIYWMHAGWRGWSRFYETGKLLLGTAEEQQDALDRMIALNPEPWGLANGLPYAEKRGVADRVISFNYGRIEGEPSFPMTNFGGTNAYDGGKGGTARGLMGNAQTHCVQLPNTFAFVRGATGQSLTEKDYIQFADDLIPGLGELIVQSWQALSEGNAVNMRAAAAKLAAVQDKQLLSGKLKGLLFGSPRRFLNDLVMQLRLRAALEDFAASVENGPKGLEVKTKLGALVQAAEAWQHQHGYQNNWYDPRLHTALRKLNSPSINAILNISYEANQPFDPGVNSPAEQVKANFHKIETYTTDLLDAMKTTLKEMQ